MKKFTGFNICLIVIVILFCDCEKKTATSPQQIEINEGLPCEKDGIIEICIDELISQNDQKSTLEPIDTLFISETQNRLEIPNAIPFALPISTYFEFSFKGDFQGIRSHVIVWWEYYPQTTDNVYSHNRDIAYIENNRGTIIMPREEMVCLDSLRGYIFCLDSDEEHQGSGVVSLRSGDFSIDIPVDASEQTVNYTEVTSRTEFYLDSTTTNYKVKNSDHLSYSDLKDGAVWYLLTPKDERVIVIGTSNASRWLNVESKERHFIVYGFAPKF